MQSSNDELHKTLTNLHSQLSEVESPTEDVRNLIVQVKADVDRLLTPTEGGKPDMDHDGLSEKLQEAVHRFEDSHPRLTQCLSGIIDVLGQMGI